MSDDWDDDDDELPESGHDLHFLSRLDRVNYDQADLARRLYRDAALVKAILDDETPSDVERVAVALAPGSAPPYAVISRGGRFVTCLAAGMVPGDTLTIPHDRLEIHLRRAALRAERDARAREVMEASNVRRLVRRIRDGGSRVTREEVAQLVALAPFLEAHYLSSYFRAMTWVATRAPFVLRMKRLSPSVEPKLRRFWNMFHAVGHYVVLASTRGRESFAVWEQSDSTERLDIWGKWYLHNPMALGRGFVVRLSSAVALCAEVAPEVKTPREEGGRAAGIKPSTVSDLVDCRRQTRHHGWCCAALPCWRLHLGTSSQGLRGYRTTSHRRSMNFAKRCLASASTPRGRRQIIQTSRPSGMPSSALH